MAPMRVTPIAFVVILVHLTAAAQSFDCKLAQSPREHAICDSPRLISLDTSIASDFKSLRAQLSPASAALVESDQREWSQWIDLVCRNQIARSKPSGSAATPAPAEPPRHFGSLGAPGQSANSLSGADDPFNLSHCLQDQYAARARDFQKTAHIGTAIIFSRAHFLYQSADQLYKSGDRPDEAAIRKMAGPDYPGFGYGALRWPQLDRKTGELTPAETAWNMAIKRRAASSGAGIFDAGQNPTFDTAVNALEDINADYVLDAANDRLLEVSLLVSSHLWVSGAFPLTIRSSFLWWFDHNRELTAEDVFLPVSAWAQFLASVATGRLHASERLKPLLRDDSTLTSAVEEFAPQTSNWTLTRNGLTVTFSQGAVAANPAGLPRVFISWEDLKPFLEPTLDPATLPTRLPRPGP
jgi:uncharacterized protein YecT (DUF1311 family)